MLTELLEEESERPLHAKRNLLDGLAELLGRLSAGASDTISLKARVRHFWR